MKRLGMVSATMLLSLVACGLLLAYWPGGDRPPAPSPTATDGPHPRASDPAGVSERVVAPGVVVQASSPADPVLALRDIVSPARPAVAEREVGWEHKVVTKEFGHWISLAEAQGIVVPSEFVLPAHLHDDFAQIFETYNARLEVAQSIRGPVLDGIVQAKMAKGDFESLRNPDCAQTPEEASQLRSALRAARKVMAKNQTVVVSGSGPEIRLIRVDPSEDSRLAQAYSVFDIAQADYIQQVAVLISPLLK